MAFGVLGVACGLRVVVGSSAVGWPTGEVVLLRLDRLFTAAVTGAALGTAGVALQTLLRNALAEPFILGLSTGAAAGLVGQRLLGAMALGVGVGNYSGVGAGVGAGLSMGIVYLASRRHGVLDPLGLLLTGVVLGTINGALIMLAVHLEPGLLRVEVSRWMMGHLSGEAGAVGSWLGGRAGVPWGVLMAAGLTAAGWGWLRWRARALDAATLSAGEAEALGVDLRRLRVGLFVVSSGLAAGAVVLAGPIAFVGLVCPHVARLMVGPAHRGLLGVSAFLGAALVILADTAGAGGALAFGVGVVPWGVFTALVGGVAFLWMLRPAVGRG
ncbi:MAG: iron ABC transporter permease, partial [Planctomycetota bacterium]